jgi:hypothetical protein
MPARLALLSLLALTLAACGTTQARLSATPAAARTQVVGTNGIEVAVPAEWKLEQVDNCDGMPTANTVVWNVSGFNLDCIGPVKRGLSVVEFGPIRPTHQHATRETIGGVRVLRLPGTRIAGSRAVRLLLPGRRMSVTVRSRDRALREQIISSLKAVRVDHNGCSVRKPSGAFRLGSRPSRPGSFVPARGLVRAIGCSYDGIWIDGSSRIGRGAATRLARVLNHAPWGLSRDRFDSTNDADCRASWRNHLSTERFEYADGHPPVTVTVHIDGCTRLGASNGRSAIQMRWPWVDQLTRDVDYVGDFNDPEAVR